MRQRAALVSLALWLATCTVRDGATEPCHAVCSHLAECARSCDPEEGPNCDPEARYREAYRQCANECRTGLRQHADRCEPAVTRFAECVEGDECGESACAVDDRRYRELCVSQPGALLCPSLCAELEVGCTPFAELGLRAGACVGDCELAVAELACLEALYRLDACSPGSGYGCRPLGDACSAELDRVRARCAELQPVIPAPAELALCAAVAPEQCRCGLWDGAAEGDCEPTAMERCLFALVEDEPCAVATQSFHDCMRELDACDRDQLRDACASAWDAYSRDCAR